MYRRAKNSSLGSAGFSRHWEASALAGIFRGFVVLLFLLASPVFAQQNAIPPAIQGVAIEQHLNEQIPLDLIFTDESGNSVKFADLFGGKPVILNLAYYECPMLCTQVTDGLVMSLRAINFDIGKEFNIATVSFDPGETPALAAAKKQKYIKVYGREGAEKGWHFLTGDQESIRKLTSAAGFKYNYDTKTDQFAHGSAIIVLTPEGKIARYFYGIEYSSRDLRFALVEASENKIGNLADQVLLFCYRYDPHTAKYTPTALNLIRAGGVLTVFAIGFLIISLKRKYV